MSNSEPQFLVIITTFPNTDLANNIAKILVEEKLAACVQVLPSAISTYTWQEKICQESENLVTIKTIATNYKAIENRLRSLHPYEIPEIIAIPILEIERNYANWLKAMSS